MEPVPGWFQFVPLILRSPPAFSKVKVTGIRDLSLGVLFVSFRRVESFFCVRLGPFKILIVLQKLYSEKTDTI